MQKTEAAPQESPALAARKRILAVRADLRAALIDRPETDIIMTGLCAGQNVLLLGEPGTGKSLAVREVTRRISGAVRFEWLMSKFSTPDEIVGPLDVPALLAGSHRRVTIGKLPLADVVFLDEVYKANSAILNYLLAAMNERTFEGAPIPLRCLVGASNEQPEDESLRALDDRFHLRAIVSRIGRGSLSRLLGYKTPALGASCTLADLDIARAGASALALSPSARNCYGKLYDALDAEGIRPSDRTWRATTDTARAVAWLDGASSVAARHLASLAPALWRDPEQRGKVEAIVIGIVAPLMARARDLIAAAEEQERIFAGTTDDSERLNAIRKLDPLITDAQKLAADADADDDAKATAGKLEVIQSRMRLAVFS